MHPLQLNTLIPWEDLATEEEVDQAEAMEEDLEVGTLEEIIITIEIKSLNPSQRLNPS